MTSFGICQEASEPAAPIINEAVQSQPLTADEKRQLAKQLNELISLRQKIEGYQTTIADLTQQRQELRDVCKMAVDAERKIQDMQLANKDKEIAALQADLAHYKEMYNLLLKKKPGIGCWLKRFFSAGICRC